MKINWKLRLKNKTVLTAIIATLVGAVYAIASQLGFDLPKTQDEVLVGFGALITILQLVGIIADPTTVGVSDSERALSYEELR